MAGFEQTITNFLAWFTPLTWALVAVALVINGVLCIVGGQEGREKAKKALPFVVLGGVLIVGAITIAKEVVGLFAF